MITYVITCNYMQLYVIMVISEVPTCQMIGQREIFCREMEVLQVLEPLWHDDFNRIDLFVSVSPILSLSLSMHIYIYIYSQYSPV